MSLGTLEKESSLNRYYDPSTGQFLSVDPDVAETGQPYAFAGDDPANASDPLGDLLEAVGSDGQLFEGSAQSIEQQMNAATNAANAAAAKEANAVKQLCSGANVTYCKALEEFPSGTPGGDCLRHIGPCTVAKGADPVAALPVQTENDSPPPYVAALPPTPPQPQSEPGSGVLSILGHVLECVDASFETLGAVGVGGLVIYFTWPTGVGAVAGGTIMGTAGAGLGFTAYKECSDL